MGYIKHDAVIVTAHDYALRDADRATAYGLSAPDPAPDVAGFVASMPEHLRQLVVGPIPSVINDYSTYVFAPDGSKEGWDLSNEVDEWRQRFIRIFEISHDDGSSPFDVVAISWGGDQQYEGGGAWIEYQHPAPGLGD